MPGTIRRNASAALITLAAVATVGAVAAPASADVHGKAVTTWAHCTIAPAGSLVIDQDTIGDHDPDSSTCFSGSGRTTVAGGNGELREVHTANNRGSIRLTNGTKEWDLSFDRNQTHAIPDGNYIIGLSINE